MEVEPGLNVITGETGAGKSILIGALSMVLGERVGREIVREGESYCEVEAVFSESSGESRIGSFLKGLGIEPGELFIRRVFEIAGRSKCYINDRRVTLATIKDLGELLVDIHSQNQHQDILKPSRQTEILDDYISCGDILKETSGAWKEYESSVKEKEQLLERQEKTRLEAERLSFELNEIDAAELSPGIENEVEAEYRVLSNAEALCRGIGELYSLIYESEGSVTENLSSAVSLAGELAGIDASLKPLCESLNAALAESESTGELLRGRLDYDTETPGRLEEILELRDRISTLKRKYGGSVEEVLSYRDRIERQLREFEEFGDIIEKLEEETSAALKRYKKHSLKLFKKRSEGAEKLSGEVTGRLGRLGMEGAEFEAVVIKSDPGPSGGSRVQFLIKTNPGTSKMDLKRVASGGEVSRVMLAVKSALAGADDVPVLIFDEIDAGIGADTAEEVAEELRRLAGYHLVISVTHLPQIAGRADLHLSVRKSKSEGSTAAVIEKLDREGRVEELARMLGGKEKEMPLKHARRLIERK